ncbi:MAG TPA: HisA/HisF-related TIM barrel protein [Candidatus Limnocylindria bacterium]|nr:HisA/HisF-related TIM barrel protein [Candidatus Limnocylindria bacterium]
MELIAAIDLLDGRAVRLTQGDYARQAAALDDPAAFALRFAGAGVRRLHIVDLEGARAGSPQQLPLVTSVLGAVRQLVPDIRVELGGGLRSVDGVAAAFDVGVDDVVLGTAAVERPAFVSECAARWPGHILVSLDLRDGRPALDGWLRESSADALDLARQLVDAGAAGLIVTDARRDGTLTGPNLDLLAGFRGALPDVRLVAAGGVGSLEHLRQLAAAGLDGAIVGLALLSGAVDVREALAV